MGRLGRVTKASISAAVSVLTILFLYGYLEPLGLDPQKILGFDMSSIFQIYGGTSVSGSPIAALIPGGATGLILYQILGRLGRSVSQVAAAATMPSPDEMMGQFNAQGMRGIMGGMGMVSQASVPAILPPDITKSQFIVLRCYRNGIRSNRDISKALSMDPGAIDAEASSLISNRYMTKDRKLTTKALELLGA